jgi:LuxR family transcriptional regulator, maltose regulon positive regulatory protein
LDQSCLDRCLEPRKPSISAVEVHELRHDPVFAAAAPTGVDIDPHVVYRPALVERVLGRGAPPICIVHAPPGYGKSYLIAEIRAHLRARPSHQLVVLDDDGSLLSGDGNPEPEIHRRVRHGERVIIATRSSGLAEQLALRFGGSVAMVSQESLAFSPEDVQSLFGDDLAAEASARLMNVTEGWPLAIRILHLDFLQGSRRQAWTLDLGALNDRLTGFFDQEVLHHLSAEDREFLLDIAQLASGEPAVVASLFPHPDAHSRFAGLCRRGLFIHKVRGHPTAYSLHPLFQEYLVRRRPLARCVVGFHRRAAESYALRGSVIAALEHGLRTGDLDYEAELIERLGGFKVLFANGHRVAAYFRAIPNEMCRRYPKALLGKLYLMVQESRCRVAAEFCDKFTRDGCFDSSSSVKLYERIVRHAISLNYGDPLEPADLSLLERQFSSEFSTDWLAQTILHELASACHYRNGRVGSSLACAQRAIQAIGIEDATLLCLYANLRVASAKLHLGDPDGAESLLLKTLNEGLSALGECPQTRMCRMLLARLRAERLDFESARALLSAAGSIAEERTGWYEGVEALLVTEVALRHEFEGADAALAYLEKAAARFAQDGFELNVLFARLLKIRVLVRTERLEEALDALQGESLRALNGGAKPPQGALLQLKLEWALCSLEIDMRRHVHDVDVGRLEALSAPLRDSCDAFLLLRQQVLMIRWLESRGNHAAAARKAAATLRSALQGGMLRQLDEDWPWLKAVVDTARRLGLVRWREAEMLAALDNRVGRPARLDDDAMAGSSTARVKLAAREQEVLDLIAEGLSSKQMSTRLQISIGTVKSYRRTLYSKLNIFTRSAAVEAAKSYQGCQLKGRYTS